MNGYEIRLGANGKGTQSLLPPSVTDDFARKWLVDFNECNPAKLPEIVIQRLFVAAKAPSGQQKAVTHREHREHKTCPVFSVSSVSSVCQQPASDEIEPNLILAAIEATLPSELGDRHRQLFEFGRRLKAMPQFANADVQAIKQWVPAWHQAALPYIGTQPFEETWLDFAEGWRKIKYASGQEPIAMAFQNSLIPGVPMVAQEYEQDQLKRLVALCRELQRAAGDKPFYLAGRIAADLLSVPHTQMAKWLRLLVLDKILDLVKNGTRHQASEYRYLGN